ncbi:peptidase C14 caspase catalytic subunit p20 [Mesorhizobium sp. B2-4-19]|uniref:caspase family protein n=1 Tax=Mesorhizobium sp. B2-4-19 TaxID=2589930 RepID=UPI00112E13B2|nr:caspase domain-containing protein [Mesorhizobium sp. B2-4-19]TPK54865.1 peptidase C14 caspase catalytic subunit p20 [Mesorhizobium sp. B2-4-19]
MRMLQKVLGFVLVLLLLMAPSWAQAGGEKRLALVIGNGAYKTGELATAANDGGLIAQTLQAAGFDVIGARDLDQDSLRGAFRDFVAKVSAAGPDAVVFVYLAGQGVQLEGDNYFLPVDAQIANPNDIPLQAMRISDVTRSLSGLSAKVSVVVLDAARPTPMPPSSQPLAGGLALVDPSPNMLIAFNAAPGTIAPEGKGPYGAYAQALAEMMREGGLSLDDVFDRTRLRVNEVTQGAEVPWHASKVSAPFVFFDRAPDAPAPRVSEAESRANRTRAIRDFDAHEAYTAALDRDTMRGYEDFLVAYPHDPMAKRVRAIVAVRREAITWRETWLRDLPNAYWSYLRRYPHGPHAWDARRRLEHFDAALEPPEQFTVYAYDVPPPPEEEIVYVDRPVLYFDDPDFDFEPPPPVPVIFLPPPPPDFVELVPPPPPVDVFVLPTPVFVPIPVFIDPPRDIVAPPNDIIFNNIHNTTVINNINNTTINEGSGQAGQPNGSSQGTLTTGQKLAVGVGATALAAKVALPPLLQKRAASAKAPNNQAPTNQAPANQGQSKLPPKLGQGVTQSQQPGTATPKQKQTPGRLTTDHALPGANGKMLPLVNGKPVLNGQNAPNEKFRRAQGKQDMSVGNGRRATGDKQPDTGNAGAAGTGQQGREKFRKLPAANDASAESGQNAQDRLRKNNPSALSGQNAPEGRQKKLPRNQGSSSGQATVMGPSGKGVGLPNATEKNKRLRKLPDANGMPQGGDVNVQRNSRQNKPNGGAQRRFEQQNPHIQALRPQKPQFNAQPKPQTQERRLPQVQQPRLQMQERRLQQEQQPRPQIQERRLPQVQQPKPQMQERRLPQQQQQQPRPQIQERRVPQGQQPQQPKPQQQEVKKRPPCGQQGEPACGK